MQRRDFLKKSAGALGGLSLGFGNSSKLQAAASRRKRRKSDKPPVEDPVLVVIFLRGGHDQLNTCVPYKDKDYYKLRPTIGINKEKVIPLNDTFAMNPGMAPLKPFWDQGRFGMVINSGSHHPTRSHFDAQDFMEYAAPGNRTVHDGWLSRYLAATPGREGDSNELRAVAMQELLPRSLRGTYPVLAVPPNLKDPEFERTLTLFEDFYSGDDAKKEQAVKKAAEARMRSARGHKKVSVPIEFDPVMATGQNTIDGLRRLRRILYPEIDDRAYTSRASDVGPDMIVQEYPGTWFASRLQALAKLIKADVGLEVAGTDINGWDHHIGMGSFDGTLARMLEFLASGLAAFMTDLGPDLDRTVIMTCTEFGRVCKENGNDGTDHGHGGPIWLMGGRLNGGRIFGEWSGLGPKALYENRDLVVTTDFRQVFHEILTDHMGFEVPETFFPGFELPEEPLGLFS